MEWSQITAAGPPGFKRYVVTWTAGHSGVMQIGVRAGGAGTFALANVQLRRAPRGASGSQQASSYRGLVMRSEFAQLGPVGWATAGGFVNGGARLGAITSTSPAALPVVTDRRVQGVDYSTGVRVPRQ